MPPPRQILRAGLVFLAILRLVSPTPSLAQSLAARADEYLISLSRDDRFSGTVLIAREGKVLFSKGYGFADLEHDVANTPQTKFRLGSVTKQFTAMAIMMLQERGKLSVQDPVSKFVPDSPAAWQDVTIHHLLTHTAGLPNLTTFPDYRRTMMMPSSTASTVARFKGMPLEFPPGQSFKYSNSGYVLLSYIIELITGAPYEDFARENIFDPLGMTESGYDHNEAILRHRATGYARPGDKLIKAPYQDMSIPSGAGALYSTVEDLLKWDQALYSEKLVSGKSLQAAFTPFKGNYAYGWTVTQQFGRKVIEHGGSINGFTSFIARYPEEKLCVIVLCNYQWVMPRPISVRLASLAFDDRDEPKNRKENK